MDTLATIACPDCRVPSRKFGKDRKGNQWFQCPKCRKTITDVPANPLGLMRLDMADAVRCLRLLAESMSMRATARCTGNDRKTVEALMEQVGHGCERLMEGRIKGLAVADVQVDEVWGFVGMKEKTRLRDHPTSTGSGDAYCYTAVERETKLVLAWHVGLRSYEDAAYFADKLALATSGEFQVSTDGFTPYATAIPGSMPHSHFAQIVKTFSTKEDGKKDSRYSPGTVIGTVKIPRHGNPDPAKISTSHVERHNLTIRMQNRRMTRLTNAFSKLWRNHELAFALQFAFYNFCRPHTTLTDATSGEGKKRQPMTPAMAAGLEDHPWTLEELIRNAGNA